MSVLNVENVSHGFGARTILEDASFRLLKGEHVGLIGANGEGKSTFLNIITGQLQPDQGKVTWSNRVTVGYLDQHAVLQKGSSIRDVLRTAFDEMYKLEAEMIGIYDKMGEATPEELDKMMEEVGEIQDILDHNSFYTIDAKIDEVANGLGLGAVGLDKDVTDLSGGQRTKVLLTKLLLQNPTILILDEPTSGQDGASTNDLRDLLRKINAQGTAILLVTHDMELLAESAIRTIVMAKGSKVFDGPTTELFADPNCLEWGLELPVWLDIARQLPTVPSFPANQPDELVHLILKSYQGGDSDETGSSH